MHSVRVFRIGLWASAFIAPVVLISTTARADGTWQATSASSDYTQTSSWNQDNDPDSDSGVHPTAHTTAMIPSAPSAGGDNASWSSIAQKFSLTYFNILYGPSVTQPSSYQPTLDGVHDSNRPVLLKNFLTLGYAISDTVSASASAYWMYVPVQGNDLLMKDPYLRLADSSLFSGMSGNFNLYADIRLHMPVTWDSRDADLLMGLQSLQIATYTIPGSRFTLGNYTSARLNVFGGLGYGNDVELYWGPNVSYQVSPTVALTLLYEIGSDHLFGSPPFQMQNDGSDIEPGVSWDITPHVNFSPYINYLFGAGSGINTASLGGTFSWKLF